jgi:ABC-type branched-subunit amino acid transport system ATPase component
VDLSSHNTNPPGVFDGEAVALSDVAEIRLEEAIASLREVVDDHGRLPTANSWTEGTALLPVEQDVLDVLVALHAATRAYVLDNGGVASSGPAAEVRDDPCVRKAYLGL